jgi:predicted TIM-barrel fold metal-dependent hydrolase
MNNLPIIDPHFHLWDLDTNYYPWLSDGVKPSAFGDYTAINKTYLIEDFLADAKNQNLVKAVHLDVGYDPKDPAGETRWLQSVADKHGFPHGIVGYADLRKPDVGDLLDEHLSFANFRGIRQSRPRQDVSERARSQSDAGMAQRIRRTGTQGLELRPSALLLADGRVR